MSKNKNEKITIGDLLEIRGVYSHSIENNHFLAIFLGFDNKICDLEMVGVFAMKLLVDGCVKSVWITSKELENNFLVRVLSHVGEI
jgi:hypothetical protein